MRCLLDEDDKQRKYNDYVAIVQSLIGQVLCAYMGGDWPLPNYGEYMYPERQKEDTQSYEEIKQSLIARLTQ